MARLIGAQRMVLQAIADLPADSAGFVTDGQVAQQTRIAVADVRDWIETLEGDGLVDVASITGGLCASITAQGRLALGLYRPIADSPAPASPQPATERPPGTTTTASTPSAGPGQPVRLFYSYSHKDEALRDELEEALALLKRQGLIAGWHDRRIGAGEEWKEAIDRNLEEARIILLLVSSSFLASDYCWDVEARRAIERHERGEAAVIPIIVRPCDWHEAPFARFQGLPKDARAVTSWSNKDEAWTDVARGIRRALEAMSAGPR